MTWCNVADPQCRRHRLPRWVFRLPWPMCWATPSAGRPCRTCLKALLATSGCRRWLVIAMCSVLTAPLGARAAHSIAGRQAQAGVRQHPVPAGGLHALQGSEQLSRAVQRCRSGGQRRCHHAPCRPHRHTASRPDAPTRPGSAPPHRAGLPGVFRSAVAWRPARGCRCCTAPVRPTSRTQPSITTPAQPFLAAAAPRLPPSKRAAQ